MSESTTQKRRRLGLCTGCGGQPREGKTLCQGCQDKNDTRMVNLFNKRLAAGLCSNCGKRPLVTARYCGLCRNRNNISTQKSQDKYKEQCYLAYGGYVCKCCGETRKPFLTLDHINGGGKKHRESVGAGEGGRKFHRWLVKNNFPDGIQILCMNCNFGKRMCGGVCPHELERKNTEQK